MRSSGPGGGFGASGVDPAAAAKPANQVERGRAKDRSFDDHLGERLDAAADKKDRDRSSADAVVPQAGVGAEKVEKAGRSTRASATGEPSASAADEPRSDSATPVEGTGMPAAGNAELDGAAYAQPPASPAISVAATAEGSVADAPAARAAAKAATGTPPSGTPVAGLGEESNAAAVETPVSALIADDGSQGDASVENGAETAMAQQGNRTSSPQRSAAAAAGYAAPTAEQSAQSTGPAPHAPANVTKDTEAFATPEPTPEAVQPKLDQPREAAVPRGDAGAPAAAQAHGQRSFDTASQDRHDEGSRSFAHHAMPLVSELTGDAGKAVLPDLQLYAGPDVAGAPAEAAVRLAVPTSLGGFQVTQIPGFEVATPVPAPGSPLPAETASSIIQSLRMQYQAGGGDAIVHIKPEHLGPVSVSIRVEHGVVSAVVTAENPAVADWLKANEHMLRDGLSSSGLHLERFAVRRDGHPAEDGRKGYQPPEPKDRRRRALPSGSTFEVTV